MNNCTPGPWRVWNLADDEKTYGENAGKPIVTTADGETEVCGVVDNPANASLIAALPDLLAACRAIVAEDDRLTATGECITDMCDRIDVLRKVMAGATTPAA